MLTPSVAQIHATSPTPAPYVAESRVSQPTVPTLLFLALHSLSQVSFEYLGMSQVRNANVSQLSLAGDQAYRGQQPRA